MSTNKTKTVPINKLNPDDREYLSNIEHNIRAIEVSLSAYQISLKSAADHIIDGLGPVMITLNKKIKKITPVLEHLHYGHVHGCCHGYYPYGHEGDDFNKESCLFTPRTQKLGCTSFDRDALNNEHLLSAAQRLYLEYEKSVDYDENGLIYGIDFIIGDFETNKDVPIIVKYLTRRIPGFFNLNQISWAEYLKTTPKNSPWQSHKGWT